METTLALATSLVVLSLYTTMYKPNQLASIVEKMVLGITIGQAMVANVLSIYADQVKPLATAFKPELIAAILVGAMYVTVLHRRLVSIFRGVMVITASVLISSGVAGTIAGVYTQVKTYGAAAVTTIGGVVMFITLLLSTAYFLYSSHFERGVASKAREVSRYMVFMCLGLMYGAEWFRWINVAVGWIIQVVTGPGIFLAAIFLAVVLLDALGILRKIVAS